MDVNEGKTKRSVRLGVLGMLLVASAVAGAEDDSESIIKYRRSDMKALGGHMGAAALIVRGKVGFHAHLASHAESVAAITRSIPALFPEGSDFGDTRAKDAVWEKWKEFEKASKDADKAAGVFVEAVKGGNKATVDRSFRALSDACKNCHKKFREKEE